MEGNANPRYKIWLTPAEYLGWTMIANLPDNIKIGIVNVLIGWCKIPKIVLLLIQKMNIVVIYCVTCSSCL